MIKPKIDVVTGVARQVISGKLDAGDLVKALCSQHLRDLKTGKARGLVFDVGAAERAVHLVRHIDKEISPAVQFVVGSLVGWQARMPLDRSRGEVYNS
jgi:hypothetical protein